VIVVAIKNTGDRGVGEFAIQVKLDDDVIDTATLSTMAANSERKVSMSPVEMSAGKHTIQAIIDVKKTVTEDDENNNAKTVEVDCPSR